MSNQLGNKVLLICPSVGIWQINGDYSFDRKFYDGLKLYESMWNGSLKVVMSLSSEPTPQFGMVNYDVINETIELKVLKANELIGKEELYDVDVVMASADDYKQADLSRLSRVMGIRCVYVIEYTLKTRLQIALVSKVSKLKKLKSIVWLLRHELKLRKAIKLSSSIQSNGVPAFKSYGKLTKTPLLYFDTRNTQNMLVKQTDLDRRLSYLDTGNALRLGFSGRLIEIKGANDLILLAEKLVKLKIKFSLNIFGAGEEDLTMRQKINELGMQNIVILHGAVDYEKELVPYLKNTLDLFVCCHKQGDPSCTYLETYACGVPVVGYANEAHAGILDKIDSGWSVPTNDIEALAKLIAFLDKNREEIKLKANTALIFAKNHTFETTFESRVKHCQEQLERA